MNPINITYMKYKTALYLLPLAMLLGSCIDEEMPTGVASSGQVESSPSSQEMLVGGLKSKMISTYNYYSSADAATWYVTQDWGYPCLMMTKEALLDGFPISSDSYNYQSVYESASNLTSYTYTFYYYYYSLIRHANMILLLEGNSERLQQYKAIASTYRALAYMDLAMMFEFHETGITELDDKAKHVKGLTVPIVTERTGREEARKNPRAPFYTLYRFIYNDLCNAEEGIATYSRSEINDVNTDVVNALMARFWITLATRFRMNGEDLALQVAHETDNDGARPLGITTAEDCYDKAAQYADKVLAAGYVPMREDQWHDVKTGFNTSNQAWVWGMKYSSKEQCGNTWCSYPGLIASEPTWGMPGYCDGFRCISAELFSDIHAGDWRQRSWISPDYAGKDEGVAYYSTQLKPDTKESRENKTNFSRLPAYANLKFRPGSGSMDDEVSGMLVDVPLMRVEEMYFIKMECALYTRGAESAKTALNNFMEAYRMEEGEHYTSTNLTDTEESVLREIMAQKYVEFWGEGIMYNDYKRLHLAIDRTGDNSNYLETYRIKSREGFCAPWLNFYIPEKERSFNSALETQMNPDPTPYCKD